MKTDLEIAQSTQMKHIKDIASKLNLNEDDLELYGKYKAKLPLELLKKNNDKKGTLILVSAITPTPAGEGKTTTSIGLTMAMNKLGKKTTVVLREPSLGPVFGVKGGAAGGGYAQVVPMEDINLHFTGDLAAVEKAHNLLSAMIDNCINNPQKDCPLNPRTIHWKRVMDMNDRSLRNIVVGLGGGTHGVPRESGFDITAASEVMAALCLAEDLQDLKEKLGNIFVGFTHDKKPVYARDLKANGAMAALLKDAIKPNLVQTLEGNPAIIHGGPFANIAQGTNSVIATRMGLALSDYVVTEAGFGFDLGAEKFFDIKCGYSGLSPKVAVLVATIRALKYHGGQKLKDLSTPNPDALRKGLENLEKHIENMDKFNVCSVVAVNRFPTDSDEEVQIVLDKVKEMGHRVALSEVWAKGGEGGMELAETVLDVAEKCTAEYQKLYDWEWSVEKKIETVAREIYGAKAIDFKAHAKKDLKVIKKLGLDKLPICIAKTQKSLSDDPDLLGRPKDFIVTVREIQISSGAGFLVPITGDIMRMPGLPKTPAAVNIDIDEDGNISGLF